MEFFNPIIAMNSVCSAFAHEDSEDAPHPPPIHYSSLADNKLSTNVCAPLMPMSVISSASLSPGRPWLCCLLSPSLCDVSGLVLSPGALCSQWTGAYHACVQCSGCFRLAWAQVLLLQLQGPLERSPNTSIIHHGKPVLPPSCPTPFTPETLEVALQRHPSGHLPGDPAQ